MDGLGDWELLDGDDDCLFDFYGDTHKSPKSKTVSRLENYFSPNPHTIVRPPIPTQLLPLPIHFNSTIGTALPDEELTKLPIETTVVPSENKAAPEDSSAAATTQVFFVKMKETDQFVDMKMDSPKSGSRGILLPQIDTGAYQFEDRPDAAADGGKMSSPRMIKTEMEAADGKEVAEWEDGGGGVNIWKWSLTGIGALCSFGVAAATICIIVFGNQHHHQNHKARFQIYATDKRMKQVVQQATRLNEVISGTRGVPLARAHISYGGYYDAV